MSRPADGVIPYGNVVIDTHGRATVELPACFEALNRDFRYQLTVMGRFAQAIMSEKVHENRFVIKTNKPGVEVSWQVTGIRQDVWPTPIASRSRKSSRPRSRVTTCTPSCSELTREKTDKRRIQVLRRSMERAAAFVTNHSSKHLSAIDRNVSDKAISGIFY